MSAVECPYCEAEFEVCQDEGFACKDSEDYDLACIYCEKTFIITPCVSYSFDARKANCKNGEAEHKIKDKIGHPREFYIGMKYCTDCGEEFNTKKEERELGVKLYMDGLKKNEHG